MAALRIVKRHRDSRTASWVLALAAMAQPVAFAADISAAFSRMRQSEHQVTHARTGHLLTNAAVWSPDGQWIVYDTRSSASGEQFDGNTVEIVNVQTGETRVVFKSRKGAHCGVATFNPRSQRVAFILGPLSPTAEWPYCAWNRQGVIVDCAHPHRFTNLDARDLVAPFTPGALRGGSHVHMWDNAGEWISFTYEDAVLAAFEKETAEHDVNLRNVGVSAPIQKVRVHPGARNYDGDYFTVVVTQTKAEPTPGSDEIKKAFEEGWIGSNGYVRTDGKRQVHALAFQGQVITRHGETISEVFVVDVPEELRVPGDGPLQGTGTRRPFPPKGTVQRRLTFTSERKFPGLQGPRHWLRSSPDGSRVAFLMKDNDGIVQLWTVSPQGGLPKQLTRNPHSVSSAFTWSTDGKFIAHVMDNSVCRTDAKTGHTTRLTVREEDAVAPRPEACVIGPASDRIAYVRPVWMGNQFFNQVFVVDVSH